MRKPFLLSAVAGTALLLTACSGRDGAGSDTSSDRPVDYAALRDFTGVSATGPDTVLITVGKGFSVDAEGDADVLKLLKIEVEDGDLKIGRKDGGMRVWDKGIGKAATIRVSLPALEDVALTGSGNVSVDRVTGKELELSLTGSGNMKVDAVSLTSLDAEVTGTGDVSVAGTARSAELSTTGTGQIDAAALKADRAEAKVMGTGDIALGSDGSVDISIMGTGDVTVRGRAKCNVDSMGTGTAKCRA